MRSNVIGRVQNTQLSKNQGLLPLYEAIVNSIDAIEDSGRDPLTSSISINILRVPTLPKIQEGNEGDEDKRYFSPIRGFEICDNGIGFTEDNYDAFSEADTQYKASKGGKGVGRFLWLKAFEKVEIDSTFRANGEIGHRKFEFSLSTPDGISNHNLNWESNVREERTIVRLVGFKEEYEKHVPHSPRKIAQRIVEHCLEYYYLTNMPLVTLIDQEEKDVISLEDLYQSLVANKNIESLNIQGQAFDVTHFFLHTHSELKHHVSYCANRRVVVTERIESKIPNLPPAVLANDDEEELTLQRRFILLRRFAAGPFCKLGAALIEVVLAVRAVGQIVSPLMVIDRG